MDAMDEDVEYEYQEAWADTLDDYDLESSDAAIAQLDTDTVGMLNLIFSVVPASIIRKPNINYIYYDQHLTTIPKVPANLQLEWFLLNFRGVSDQF